jgi:four helix bundle protein
MFGLTSQTRRASVSVVANIAEGCCRNGDADFARFLQMAAGSASEVEYHRLLSRDLELLKRDDYRRLSDEVVEVKRMLASLIQRLRADSFLPVTCCFPPIRASFGKRDSRKLRVHCQKV